MSDGPFFIDAFLFVAVGVPATLLLTVVITVFALPFAIGLALLRLSSNRLLSWAAGAYVIAMRSLPLLVLLFLVYYGLSQFSTLRQSIIWPIIRDPFWCAAFVIALSSAAYGSEVVRGGLLSLPRGEIEAAKAFGLSGFSLARRVIVPLTLRQALPAYGSELILTLKATSLASIITVNELTARAVEMNDITFRPFEVFAAAGVIYLFLNFLIAEGVRIFEKYVLRSQIGAR
jgi:octopine/nopaline transport system permease protein